MFNILKNLESDLGDTISNIENEWGDDPKKDYLFHEITGVKKAVDVVKRAQSKELLELDRWAHDYINKQEQGDTLSD